MPAPASQKQRAETKQSVQSAMDMLMGITPAYKNLMLGIAETESGFDPFNVSGGNASGVFQLQAATFKDGVAHMTQKQRDTFNIQNDLQERFDPQKATAVFYYYLTQIVKPAVRKTCFEAAKEMLTANTTGTDKKPNPAAINQMAERFAKDPTLLYFGYFLGPSGSHELIKAYVKGEHDKIVKDIISAKAYNSNTQNGNGAFTYYGHELTVAELYNKYKNKLGDVPDLNVSLSYNSPYQYISTNLLGVPYYWGQTNPYVGLDCNGFVGVVCQYLGVHGNGGTAFLRASEVATAHNLNLFRFKAGDPAHQKHPSEKDIPLHAIISIKRSNGSGHVFFCTTDNNGKRVVFESQGGQANTLESNNPGPGVTLTKFDNLLQRLGKANLTQIDIADVSPIVLHKQDPKKYPLINSKNEPLVDVGNGNTILHKDYPPKLRYPEAANVAVWFKYESFVPKASLFNQLNLTKNLQEFRAKLQKHGISSPGLAYDLAQISDNADCNVFQGTSAAKQKTVKVKKGKKAPVTSPALDITKLRGYNVISCKSFTGITVPDPKTGEPVAIYKLDRNGHPIGRFSAAHIQKVLKGEPKILVTNMGTEIKTGIHALKKFGGQQQALYLGHGLNVETQHTPAVTKLNDRAKILWKTVTDTGVLKLSGYDLKVSSDQGMNCVIFKALKAVQDAKGKRIIITEKFVLTYDQQLKAPHITFAKMPNGIRMIKLSGKGVHPKAELTSVLNFVATQLALADAKRNGMSTANINKYEGQREALAHKSTADYLQVAIKDPNVWAAIANAYGNDAIADKTLAYLRTFCSFEGNTAKADKSFTDADIQKVKVENFRQQYNSKKQPTIVTPIKPQAYMPSEKARNGIQRVAFDLHLDTEATGGRLAAEHVDTHLAAAIITPPTSNNFATTRIYLAIPNGKPA